MTPEQMDAVASMDMPERYKGILIERAEAGDSAALLVIHKTVKALRLAREWQACSALGWHHGPDCENR